MNDKYNIIIKFIDNLYDLNDPLTKMNGIPKESRTLEFKREAGGNFGKITRTVTAFANDIGGEIWIGVSDNGQITGLSEPEVERLHDDLPRSLFDSIKPTVPFELSEKNVNGRLMMILKVFSGPQKPYYISREGIPKGIYVRVGTSVMRAKPIQLDELYLAQKRVFYDQTLVPEVPFEALDKALLKSVYPSLNTRTMEHDGLLRLNPLSRQMETTVAGVLFFHPAPHRHVAESFIVFSRYDGDNLRHPSKNMDITGPLSMQLEEALQVIAPYLRKNYKLKGARLAAQSWDIPQRAIREALGNALFHRKYNLAASTRVSLFPSRLEIFSPGNFPGPMDPGNMGDGTSYIRNLSICRIARKMELMEKRGTGIRLIIDEAKSAGLKAPLFIEGADFVKTVLSSVADKSIKTVISAWDRVSPVFETSPLATSNQLAAVLEVSKVTALKMIKAWIHEGKLMEKGSGPAKRYEKI